VPEWLRDGMRDREADSEVRLPEQHGQSWRKVAMPEQSPLGEVWEEYELAHDAMDRATEGPSDKAVHTALADLMTARLVVEAAAKAEAVEPLVGMFDSISKLMNEKRYREANVIAMRGRRLVAEARDALSTDSQETV